MVVNTSHWEKQRNGTVKCLFLAEGSDYRKINVLGSMPEICDFKEFVGLAFLLYSFIP